MRTARRSVAVLSLTLPVLALAPVVPAAAVQVPGATPVHVSKSVLVPSGVAGGFLTLFTVPAGKTLRVEHASCFAQLFGGSNLTRCRLQVPGPVGTVPVGIDLVVADVGPMGSLVTVGAGHAYAAGGPLTLRAAAGESVVAFVVRAGILTAPITQQVEVSIVGLLEDVPAPPE